MGTLLKADEKERDWTDPPSLPKEEECPFGVHGLPVQRTVSREDLQESINQKKIDSQELKKEKRSDPR